MSEIGDARGLGEVTDLERGEGGLPIYPLGRGDRLSRFDWVPFHIHRFRTSRFVATVDRAAGFCAMVLWTEAACQDPAGTLPEDDLELANLAGFGRDVASWRELKDGALYGWSPCLVRYGSKLERRLWHRTILEVVLWQRDHELARKAKSADAVDRSRLSRLRSVMHRAGCNRRMIDDEQMVERVDRLMMETGTTRRTVDAVRAAVERVSMSDTVLQYPRPIGGQE